MREQVQRRLNAKVSQNALVQIGYVLMMLFWAAGVGLWLLLKNVYRLLAVVTIIVAVMAGVTYGWWWGAAVACWPLLALAGWFVSDRQGFSSWWYLRFRFFRRYWRRWREVQVKYTDPAYPDKPPKVLLPEFTSTVYVDTLPVIMPPMQKVEHYVRKRKEIASTLNVLGCRAVPHPSRNNVVDLWLWHDDPLKSMNPAPFPIPEPPADGDWYRWFQRNMLYGIYENGSPAGIDLTQRLWLVVGKSRAGKSSSRVWPVVRMSAPMVAAKRLRYCVNDWKEGLELQAGRPIFESNGWYSQTLAESARRLRNEVDRMLTQAANMSIETARATDAAGIKRKLDVLTEERPWTVVIVDELKSVMNPAYEERETAMEIISCLLRIQQIGLACGYSIIAGTQQGHKDILGQLRDGFTALDCLAVEYKSETYMLFDKDDVEMYDIAPHLLHIPEPEDDDQDGDQAIGWKRRPGYPRLRGSFVSDEEIWDLRRLIPEAFERTRGEAPPQREQPQQKPTPMPGAKPGEVPLHLTQAR